MNEGRFVLFLVGSLVMLWALVYYFAPDQAAVVLLLGLIIILAMIVMPRLARWASKDRR